MLTIPLPAIALAAVPKRRLATLELAIQAEARGFAGIYCASFGDALALSQAAVQSTERIPVGTSIVDIYVRRPDDYAQTAAFIHEISRGRFRLGVGVSHDPIHDRAGIRAGRPLGDMRAFVEALRAVPRVGELPPVVLAALRRKMVALSAEIGSGVVFANASRSHLPDSLSVLPEEKRNDPEFFIGNMLPTCISDDLEAAAAVSRRTLEFYVTLPNYRNYWKEAGYTEEMEAIEKALAARERERIPKLMTDRWLSDSTLYGPPARVLEGLEAWYDAGLRTPILVPSSVAGNQMKAFEELFALFAR